MSCARSAARLRQERRASAPGNGGDQAVGDASGGDPFASTEPIDPSGCVEVPRRVEPEQTEPGEQPAQLGLGSVGRGTGQHLHHHRLGDTEIRWRRRLGSIAGNGRGLGDARTNQLLHPLVDSGPRCAVELHPCSRVGEDHASGSDGPRQPGPSSRGGSAMAWAPRIASASRAVIGCPARCRRPGRRPRSSCAGEVSPSRRGAVPRQSRCWCGSVSYTTSTCERVDHVYAAWRPDQLAGELGAPAGSDGSI